MEKINQDEKNPVITSYSIHYTKLYEVLSKIDGHLVDDAFTFGVGEAKVDAPSKGPRSIEDIVFFPEAASRFPGLVGQTIVLGGVIASILIWGSQNKNLIRKEISKVEAFHHAKFMTFTGIGLMLVFASNIAMLAIQSLRLDVITSYSIHYTKLYDLFCHNR